jgi:hypothetical protein
MTSHSYTHHKESSTDSAVYVLRDGHSNNINHVKAFSSESTDSMHELNDINMAALQLDRSNDDDFLPPPPDDLLQENEEDNEEVIAEKEKPQRTINRKKKDGPVSRNGSCVSTDSTTSTATVDSGIVVRLDSSPRTSPSSQYYYNKDLCTSRETLDDDVRALEEEAAANRPSSSTPDRYTNSYSGDIDSLTTTPDIDDLDTEKVNFFLLLF